MQKLRPSLWIGDEETVLRRKADMRRAGITAVLNVADDVPVSKDTTWNFTSLHVPLKDFPNVNPPWLIDQAVSSLRALIDNGHVVLVHCRLGINRAPSICAAYLHAVEGVLLSEVWREIKEKRGIVKSLSSVIDVSDTRTSVPDAANAFFYRFGRDTLGPVLRGFTRWLIEKTARYQKVIFQSRGGYAMWYFYVTTKPKGSPPGYIFYASRDAANSLDFPAYCRHIFGDASAVATVDTGWRGTMQETMSSYVKAEIGGFYLGTQLCEAEGRAGFLFEQWWDHETEDWFMWESILNMLSPADSVRTVYKVGDEFCFTFRPPEYDRNHAMHFRAGVFDSLSVRDRASAWDAIKRVHYAPTEEELKYIGDIPYVDEQRPIRAFWKAARSSS